jgi:hypothetical protein
VLVAAAAAITAAAARLRPGSWLRWFPRVLVVLLVA